MSSKLREELKDREYRDAYVAATVRNGVAFQVRAMRESRGWDQKKLAAKMGNEKLQPIVSRYENPDYGRFTVSSLLDLAKAFDVGLIVRFAPFSELIERDDKFPSVSLDVQSYAKEQLATPIFSGVTDLHFSNPIILLEDVYLDLLNTSVYAMTPTIVDAYQTSRTTVVSTINEHLSAPLWRSGESYGSI
jgi:transcriptional regulator with XRE-family HTH domain